MTAHPAPADPARGGIVRGAAGLLLAITALLAFAPPAGAQSVPGAVQGLAAYGLGNIIGLRWDPPESDGGSRLTGYRYRHRTDGSAWTDWIVHPISSTSTGRIRRLTLSGFDESETQDIEVQAQNAHGNGPGTIVTVHAKAPAPTGLSLVRATTSALTFSWSPVTGTGGTIERYRWEYKKSSRADGYEEFGYAGPDNTEATNEFALQPRTSYDFRVRAENVRSDGGRVGDWSTTITEMTRTAATIRAVEPTPLTVPALQTNDDVARLRITLSSGGSWNAGVAASHFSVTGLPGVRVDSVLPPSGRSIDVVIDYDGSDLSSNATLKFHIAPEAHDDSNTIVATIPVTAVLSTVSVADIRMTEGAHPWFAFFPEITPSPGQPITARWAMRSEPGDTATQGRDYGSYSRENPTTLRHRYGLYLVVPEDTIDEDDETFILTLSHLSANARFAGGGATLTAKGTIVDDDTKASAPTGLSAVARRTLPGFVDLKWAAPADLGMLNGRAATVVEYQYRFAATREGLDAARWSSAGSTSVSSLNVFANLDRHFGDYHFQVRAITGVTDENGAPAGAVSAIASATLRPPVPTVPGALRATQRTESVIQIAWSASTYSGSEAVVYTSERRASGSGDPWAETESGSDTHRRFSGLDAGTDYDFRVRACAAGTDHCGDYAQGTFATLAAPAAAVATLELTPLRIDEGGPDNVATLRATLDTAVRTTTTLNVSAAPPGVVTLDSTTLTIPADETESTGSGIRVTAVDDEVASGKDATVTLSATAPAGVSAPALVTLTVAEDDTAPDTIALSVHPTSVPEDGSATQVTVSAAFPPGSATLPTATVVTVRVGASGDTATEGTDYAQVGDLSVTIPARRARGTRTFTFTPIRDADDSEGPETVSVTGSAAGFTVEPAALIVADSTPIDSGSATLSVADASAPEGESITFTVTVAGATPGNALELVATPSSESGDTATEGTDYATVAQDIRIAVGQRSATFSVATVGDDEAEADETFTVTLSPRPGTTLPSGVRIADATATGTIVDDDGTSAVHHLPLFVPAADALGRQSFARIVNDSGVAGEVRIDAFDDEGTPYGPLTLHLGAHEVAHFNSEDLESGNPARGLDGATGAGVGRWRLALTSDLDLEVLSYLRTRDGGLASMHDLVPRTEAGEHRVVYFNPASNSRRASALRLVNPGAEPAEVVIEGTDGDGESPGTAVHLSVPAGGARRVTAQALESADGRGEDLQDLSGALGDGAGKWRLVVSSDEALQVMSLVSTSAGHLNNLSTAPGGAATGTITDDDGAVPPSAVHHLPLFVPASDAFGRQSFARIVNDSDVAGEVRIDAFDDAGEHYGPLTLYLDAHEAVQFNSHDLETGNPDQGLDGATGAGEGRWRLALTSDLDLEVLGYLRFAEGGLASMHDLVPRTEAGGHRVVFFNPASAMRRLSALRLVNPGTEAAEVVIEGTDDTGASPGSAVHLSVPAGGARMVTARALESTDGRGESSRDLSGALGDGVGKWRLVVRSDQALQVMSLVSSPAGHLNNLSTAPGATTPPPAQ